MRLIQNDNMNKVVISPDTSLYYDAGCLGFLCIRRCARSGCPVGGYPTRPNTLTALGFLPSLYWSGIKHQKFLTFDYELINRFHIFAIELKRKQRAIWLAGIFYIFPFLFYLSAKI